MNVVNELQCCGKGINGRNSKDAAQHEVGRAPVAAERLIFGISHDESADTEEHDDTQFAERPSKVIKRRVIGPLIDGVGYRVIYDDKTRRDETQHLNAGVLLCHQGNANVKRTLADSAMN